MPPTPLDPTPPARRCFVISPIGADGSAERDHADNVFEFIIRPAIEKCGLIAHRADHLPEPGRISEQMFRDITTSDCCIAVLTGHNPNVFYELAVAHTVGTPVVVLIGRGESVPFDVMDQRCIRYDFNPKMLFQGVYWKEVIAHLTKLADAGWERRPLFGSPAGTPNFGRLPATLVGELSADWVTKRDRLSAGQRRLLKALEQAIDRHGGSVPVVDLISSLPEKYSPSELHYRMETLRLLGFVELMLSQATRTFGEPAPQEYRLSAGYREVFEAESNGPTPGYERKTGDLGPPLPGAATTVTTVLTPAQQAARTLPPSADICPVNRATQVYRRDEPFELAACGQRLAATDGRLTVNGRDYGTLSDGDRIEVLSNGTWTINGLPRMPE